jgi:hypothetical protein
LIGDWVDPRASLENIGEVKISWRYWDLNPDPSVIQPVAATVALEGKAYI